MGKKYSEIDIENRKNEIKNIVKNKFLTVDVVSVEYVKSDKYIVGLKCKQHNELKYMTSKTLLHTDCYVCDICQKEEHIKSMFPLRYSKNCILNLINVKFDKTKNNYIVDVVDNENYKYQYNYKYITTAKSSNYILNRFFKQNYYTKHNINNFLKLNDIDLKLENDISNLNGAREKLVFTDSDGRDFLIAWNDIQSKPERYATNNGSDFKLYYDKFKITKEKASEIIIKKYKLLNRPLIQSDFENTVTSSESVGIRIIFKYWGNFSNMLKDLKLPEHDNYFKPNSSSYIPHKEYFNLIEDVCNYVKSQNRNVILYEDFNLINSNVDITTIRRHCKMEGKALNECVKIFGCEIQKAGNGFNYIFDDNEKVVSKYEYDFSNYLRSLNLKYNVDYFRDIEYRKLDKEYNGKMNCDYKIIIGGRIFYVELAGILGNKEHEECFYNNQIIKSKSKEKYRLSLTHKKEMFERNSLDYYILLPSKMNSDGYSKILNKYINQ